MATERLLLRDVIGGFAPGQDLRAVLLLTYSFDGKWLEEGFVPDLFDRRVTTALVLRDIALSKEVAHLKRELRRSGHGASQPLHRWWAGGSDGQDAQAVTVVESEAGETLGQVLPKLGYAEVGAPAVHVMEKDDATLRHLGKPGLEVPPHCVKGMVTIDMQQVDAGGGEVRGGLLEGRSNQSRESSIVTLTVFEQLPVVPFAVGAGVRVAAPGIDGISRPGDLKPFHRLTEGTV